MIKHNVIFLFVVSYQFYYFSKITFFYLFFLFIFFFNDTATTEIYTLSLHDALPIPSSGAPPPVTIATLPERPRSSGCRSEEHTSELQSHHDLVCRLLLEKKKKI